MISRLLIPLLIASQPPLMAEEDGEEKKNDILSRVPIGATSTNVTIPTFDKLKKRASLLTAKTVVVDNKDELSAEGIVMSLFDKEEKMHATGTLVTGKYLLEKEQLVAEGKVHLKSTDNAFEMTSDGGIFRLPSRQALFLGPGETFFTDPPKPKTAMKLHPVLPLVAGLQFLVAAPPPEITEEELDKIDRMIAPRTNPREISAEELSQFERMVAPRIIPPSQADEIEQNNKKTNAGLMKRLASYLESVGKTELLLQVKSPAPDPPAEKERVLEEGQTSITFDGGAYFDGENYEMVYLGKISLKQKNLSVTCNKDLKVIFDPPTEDEEKDKENKEEDKGAFKGIGEMKQLTASGNLTLRGEDENGSKITVIGDRAFYNKATQQVLVRGDYLEFRRVQDGQASNLRSHHKDAFIEFKFDGKNLKNGQTSKNGRWEFFHDTGKRNN